MLAIIGLTIFETVFEARARYLFTYIPMYIILAIMGGYSLKEQLKLFRIKEVIDPIKAVSDKR